MSESLPPRVQLQRMANGYWVSQAIHVAALLGVADAIPNGPNSEGANLDELAERVGADRSSLARLLRALCSLSLFAQDAAGRYTLTDAGRPMRKDAPDSLRDYLLFACEREHYAAWGELLHSVCTGQRAFDRVFGQPIFEYLKEHPHSAEVFDAAMASGTADTALAVAAGWDFNRHKLVVDVGGGVGTLLAGILAVHPQPRGMIADLGHVLERAEPWLAAHGMAERIERRPTDFFKEVPSGGDCYLMKSILHDWADDKAIAILQNVRRAMTKDAVLLVAELVIPPPGVRTPASQIAPLMDLNMMVMTGGCERTTEEWRTLLAAGGFRLETVHALRSAASLIEAHPV
jgi:hypothetical protein